MRLKTLCALLALGVTAGCATQTEPPTWDVRPVLDVRHGMTQARAYYQLGRYYQGQRRVAEAQKAYEQAVAADAGHAEALNALAALYAEQGDLARALETFRRIEALAPDQAYLHNNLGYTLLLQGRPADAIAEFRRALSLDPSYERAWINLERAAQAGGDTALAEQAKERRLVFASWARRVPADADPAPSLTASPGLSSPAGDRSEPVAIARAVPDTAHLEVRPLPPQAAIRTAPRAVQSVEAPAMVPVTLRSYGGPGGATLEPVRTLTLELAASPTPAPAPTDFRLEVSNGNGVRHFATRFSAMLRKAGQPVARITNHRSFDARATVIEYRSGYAAAADALNAHFRLGASLQELGADRLGTDVRVILGKDLATRSVEAI